MSLPGENQPLLSNHNNNNNSTAAYQELDDDNSNAIPSTTMDGEADPNANVNATAATRDTIAQELNLATFTVEGNVRIFRIVFNTIELIALAIILALTWDKECGSDAHQQIKLHVMSIAYCVLDFLIVIGLIQKWFAYYPGLFRVCVQFGTIIGTIFMFTLFNSQCHKTNPALFTVVVIAGTLNLLTAFLPLFLIMLLICCLPCLVMCLPRFLRFFPIDNPATDEELALLPSFTFNKNTYHLGGSGYPEALPQFQPNNNANNNANTTNYATMDDTPPQCPICLCEYEDDVDTLRRFCCKHDFHKDCIDNWLKTKAICPICRTSIIEHDASGDIISVNGVPYDPSALLHENDHTSDYTSASNASNSNLNTQDLQDDDGGSINNVGSATNGGYVAVTINPHT